jgi:hypothetical protein
MTDLCSVASRERAEPLTATASRVERWLLVEHPGAWGPESVPSSRLEPTTARHLAQLAAAAGARLLMVRRHGGGGTTELRQVLLVDSRPGRESVQRQVVTDLELASLGLAAGWLPYDGPLYLVCTHGRHDRCCALRGRPVAHALTRRFPDRTWESSHVGGDRFAANVVVLPEGLYLGQVAEEDAVAVVEALAAGTLPAGLVRGRSSLPLPVQAAQQFAREALGCWGTGDLALVSQRGAGEDAWAVRLAAPDVEVVVRYDRTGGGQHLLTCDAEQAKPVPLFRQVSLTKL